MPDEDANIGGSLVWSLENDDVTCNLRIVVAVFILYMFFFFSFLFFFLFFFVFCFFVIWPNTKSVIYYYIRDL